MRPVSASKSFQASQQASMTSAVCQPVFSISTTPCAPGAHGLGEFGEEQVHRGGVEPGHHQRHAGVAHRAHHADDPGGLVADIAQPPRGRGALPPDIAGAVFLAAPRLVLASDLDPVGFGMGAGDFGRGRGEAPFLKAS
jgi:hypothetical protein